VVGSIYEHHRISTTSFHTIQSLLALLFLIRPRILFQKSSALTTARARHPIARVHLRLRGKYRHTCARPWKRWSAGWRHRSYSWPCRLSSGCRCYHRCVQAVDGAWAIGRIVQISRRHRHLVRIGLRSPPHASASQVFPRHPRLAPSLLSPCRHRRITSRARPPFAYSFCRRHSLTLVPRLSPRTPRSRR